MSKKINLDELEPPRKLTEDVDTSCFYCEYEPVDVFIHEEAKEFQRERLGTTYLWFYRERLVGFATISMADLRKEKIQSSDRPSTKGGARENFPAMLIGQLGVQKEYQNGGIGKIMCAWCHGKAIALSEEVGCRFMVLHSEKRTIKWYEARGFKLIPKQGKRKEKLMFLNIIPSLEN